MKVAILAGGKGTRLAEETSVRPKPMVEIGSRPILWHIMMMYSHYGFHEFAVALGYKGEYIKRYFAEYGTLSGDLTVNIGQAEPVVRHHRDHAPWTVDLIDTGDESIRLAWARGATKRAGVWAARPGMAAGSMWSR